MGIPFIWQLFKAHSITVRIGAEQYTFLDVALRRRLDGTAEFQVHREKTTEQNIAHIFKASVGSYSNRNLVQSLAPWENSFLVQFSEQWNDDE